jgi:formylglycine-generating enzyme required for sulfatase activity
MMNRTNGNATSLAGALLLSHSIASGYGAELKAEDADHELAAGSVKKSAKGDVEMVYVPAGEFTMGTRAVVGNEMPERKIYVDGFYIGKNDVTVAHFRAYCDAAGYKYA